MEVLVKAGREGGEGAEQLCELLGLLLVNRSDLLILKHIVSLEFVVLQQELPHEQDLIAPQVPLLNSHLQDAQEQCVYFLSLEQAQQVAANLRFFHPLWIILHLF